MRRPCGPWLGSPWPLAACDAAPRATAQYAHRAMGAVVRLGVVPGRAAVRPWTVQPEASAPARFPTDPEQSVAARAPGPSPCPPATE
jgi:hypothetical protein